MARYRIPPRLFVSVGFHLATGRSVLASEAAELLSNLEKPAIVNGADRIPATGPLVIAANHYQRRGLWIGWPGSAITLAVVERRGRPLHWLVTGGMRLCQPMDRGPQIPFTGRLLGTVARQWEMAALPLEGTMARAAAVRTWLRSLEQGDAGGVFPEGLRGRSDRLRAPDPRYRVLCRLIAARGIPVLPAGISEIDGALSVTFGRPAVMADADKVMRAVAGLLPAEQAGAYRAALERVPDGTLD